MAVTSQPGSFSPSDFQTNLFDCCSDCSTCLCGYFCLPCLGCSIASDMGECCLCGLGMPIRSVYRTKYNIKGSMCNDYMIASCCMPCATCQLKRDIDMRKQQGIF
ncbi:placenta associated 8, tandem duplicate 2 [Tachysurus vachellii]|uniref:placenta associated 8, tandem duplicate 2 n=1 Tax=Tachysurus vachellii TaxID=175792 RepID=UPI00296B130C|nr:placenta associated 8, tandem duplicate 2 [Tachysurus vachellii]